MRRTSVNFFAIRNFESPLSAFLRVRVCVLTIDQAGQIIQWAGPDIEYGLSSGQRTDNTTTLA